MTRRYDRSTDSVGPVRLTLELCRRLDSGNACWTLVASIPGRESVALYRYDGRGGRLTESQLRDLSTTVANLAETAVITVDGSQQELRLVT